MKRLTSQERDAIVQALLAKYEADRQTVEKTLPELAELLRQIEGENADKKLEQVFGLTELERETRWQSLRSCLERLREKGTSLSKEEAIKGLEDAAALIEDSWMALAELDRTALIKLLKIATGLSLRQKGKGGKAILSEGAPARRVSIMMGITLLLTWDKRLVAVEVEPKKLRERAKALSFVGIGRDSATDVAEHHDRYFVETLEND